MDDTKKQFVSLLDDFEDYIRTGYRKTRPAPSSEPSRNDMLAGVAEEIAICSRCPLSEGRTRPVPGAGSLDPLVMLVGEAPGSEEDRTGVPFVGKAGQYLDKWLEAIGLDRTSDCYIGNVIKCRPPGNRDPLPEETALCIPYLERQVDILRPKIILTLGRISGRILTGTDQSLGSLRGKTYRYRGVPVVPTYHPSGVLRNPDYRRDVWDDLRRLRSMLNTL